MVQILHNITQYSPILHNIVEYSQIFRNFIGYNFFYKAIYYWMYIIINERLNVSNNMIRIFHILFFKIRILCQMFSKCRILLEFLGT